ncbi:hypothetical protein DERP_007657 [Dermatophagoides pteronyssinus]|uniref:Uncharacterized protein n=1 Tax=Dermatophagoides pteronyssinus TaxID=6956 RepID=A0ABQ8JKC6_DERPT|nr:hypothetical protein DERP_007657 [Dermatophagoides pteronyssinus]
MGDKENMKITANALHYNQSANMGKMGHNQHHIVYPGLNYVELCGSMPWMDFEIGRGAKEQIVYRHLNVEGSTI